MTDAAPRTPVVATDIVAAIVTALNGATVNGGVLSAVARGHEVNVSAHADSDEPLHQNFNVLVH